ncbi:MAG: FixH family protein [Pseudomonadota bacterium]
MQPTRPAWREPMVWLVVAIPAASVVASFALLFAAARSSGNNDLVADPVQRTAQIQTADLGPDSRAARLRLAALLRIDGADVEVLPLTGNFDAAAPLVLALRHPTDAARDRSLVLQPATTSGWRIPARIASGNDWNLQLGPADGSWRLQGRLPRAQRSARLDPAQAAP